MTKELDDFRIKDDDAFQASVMNNTYLIITNQITIEQLFEGDRDFGLLYDPENPNENIDDVIDTLLDHFIYTEEYEKCQTLIEIKKVKK